jgi:heptosyltransferase-2
VGFETSAGRWLYSRRVAYRDDRHHAERLWNLATEYDRATPTPEQIRPRLFPSDDDRAAVDALLAEHGGDAQVMIALAPASVWATKRWPYYAELARALPSRATIAVVGSRDDTPLAAEIAAAVPRSIVDATGRLSLLGSAELIRRCAVLVTNDSAPQHLASVRRPLRFSGRPFRSSASARLRRDRQRWA